MLVDVGNVLVINSQDHCHLCDAFIEVVLPYEPDVRLVK